MAIYSLGVRTTGVGVGTPGLEIRALRALDILEIGIFLAAATASTFGIGRPANTPAGGTVNAGQAEDPNSAASTSGIVLSGWTTTPTAPTNFLRRVQLPATIGAGIIWTFPERTLRIVQGGALVLWNISAAGVSDFYVRYDD